MHSHPDWRRATGAGASQPGSARGRGKLHWLLVSVGWLIIVSVAFLLGYLLAAHDTETSLARIQALQTERDSLSERLAAQRAAQIKLERSHQMDVKAQRVAQEQLLRLEEERMRLEQQLTHLRALLGASGRGVVEVDSLVVAPLEDGGFHYRLTLSQLVPDFGRSEGEVVLSLVSESGDGRSVTPLADLADGSAGRHLVSFEHFQVFEGRFQLHDGAEPVDLIVEILPKDDTLQASKQALGWRAALAPPTATPTPSMRTEPPADCDGVDTDALDADRLER